MKRKIWKYTLGPSMEQELYLPVDSEILSVLEQNGQICFWVSFPLGNEDLTKVSRIFYIVPTNDVYDSANKKFLGTVQIKEHTFQTLVFHIFEAVYE